MKSLWDFQEMDPMDPQTWGGGQLRAHAMQELNNSGMVEVLSLVDSDSETGGFQCVPEFFRTFENKVRLAQYISMTPADPKNAALRERRIDSWRERRAPEGYAFPGDPREWERTKCPVAELTSLGRRLLGMDEW